MATIGDILKAKMHKMPSKISIHIGDKEDQEEKQRSSDLAPKVNDSPEPGVDKGKLGSAQPMAHTPMSTPTPPEGSPAEEAGESPEFEKSEQSLMHHGQLQSLMNKMPTNSPGIHAGAKELMHKRLMGLKK